jgi:protein gp37
MGDTTGIEWTEKTWNPWHGCTKVSAGCDNCYMFRDKLRFGQNPEVVTRSKSTFRAPLKWRDPALVFTCSWSDWFHKDADPWRDEAWEIIKATPHLTYQILTKRPGRIARHLPADWGEGYPNVWLGTSVEDQSVDHRIRQLADAPARTRFLSCEPLLGPLDIQEHAISGRIHWVIVGGESGAGYRVMNLDDARFLVDQCRLMQIPLFMKQLGGWPDKQGDPAQWPESLRVRQMPTATAPTTAHRAIEEER